MQRFTSFDGTNLAYDVEGDGPAVLLVHGFAGDALVNWMRPGVVGALVRAGYRVIAYDARGHGQSTKPHDPAAYEDGAMVRDARALLDHLAVDSVFVAGYSMGAIVSACVTAEDARVRALVLGGIGSRLLERRSSTMRRSFIADALTVDDPRAVRNVAARAFRRFADRQGGDREALAAIQRARPLDVRSALPRVTVPVLVLAGDGDTLAGDPHGLAAQLPNGVARVLAGNHLSAVNDPAFARSIVDFFTDVRRRSAR